VELKVKDDDLKKAEEAHQTAVGFVEARAKDLEDSRVALLACMKEAKAAIDSAFAKGGARLSEALPEADPGAFLEWLQVKVGQYAKLLDGISDLRAYGAAIAIARTFQVASCDHLKKIGWVPHKFPSVDGVRKAVRDPQCKNDVVRFLKKFWSTRGRALAFDVAAVGTHEVLLGFCIVIFPIFFCFVPYYFFIILTVVTAKPRSSTVLTTFFTGKQQGHAVLCSIEPGDRGHVFTTWMRPSHRAATAPPL
jgi:hypothetical protein